MSNAINLNTDQTETFERLYQGVQDHPHLIDQEIINLEYFCYGLVYLTDQTTLDREALKDFDINHRTTSNYETRHGMTDKQVSNFVQYVYTLGYVSINDQVELTDAMLKIITKHGLVAKDIIDDYLAYEQQIETISSEKDAQYQPIIDQLQTANQKAQQQNQQIKADVATITQLVRELQTTAQTHQTVINQIREHTGYKFSRDAFLNHYFTLTKQIKGVYSSADVLNHDDEDMYEYELCSHQYQPQALHSGNILSELDLTHLDRQHVIDTINSLYAFYLTQPTNSEGYLIGPLKTLDIYAELTQANEINGHLERFQRLYPENEFPAIGLITDDEISHHLEQLSEHQQAGLPSSENNDTKPLDPAELFADSKADTNETSKSDMAYPQPANAYDNPIVDADRVPTETPSNEVSNSAIDNDAIDEPLTNNRIENDVEDSTDESVVDKSTDTTDESTESVATTDESVETTDESTEATDNSKSDSFDNYFMQDKHDTNAKDTHLIGSTPKSESTDEDGESTSRTERYRDKATHGFFR